MEILVTGAAGFIGSSLTRALLARGDSVVGLDNFHDYYSPEQKRSNVTAFVDEAKFTLYEQDFCSENELAKIFDKHSFDAIAHLGAMANVRYSVKYPQLFVDTNIGGTSKILNAAVAGKVPHIVFASTSSVYGSREKVPFFETEATDAPLAPYPATKKAAELLGHAYHNMYGINFTALRFFNVYGPSGRPDMMPYIVLEHLLAEEEITLFDSGKLSRDWTYVEDIVQGVMAAIDTPLGFEIFNLGRGEPVEMTEFMRIAEEITGAKALIKNAPAPASEPKITFANVDKAKKLLGYNPKTSLPEGYAHFWEWLKDYKS